MKVRTGNSNFVYELSCDQMCGKGHYSMRGTIVVENQQDFDKWMASLKPEYLKAFPAMDPSAKSDTSKMVAQVALNK